LSQFRKKDGALDHIVTISNIYACGDWFVGARFTNSMIRFVEDSLTFLEAEAIDGRG
jgi:hypothetical protein